MKRLKNIILVMGLVLTGSVLAAAVFTTFVAQEPYIRSTNLWGYLVTSLLSACTILIYPENRGLDRKEAGIRIGIQYVLINLIVMIIGGMSGWYDYTDAAEVTAMLVSIAVIFAAISLPSWRRSSKDADKLNEQLSRKNQSDLK